MSKKTIYLVRHGQTNFNLQGIVQGGGVDAPLNETGLKQAKQFYQHYKAIPFGLVITSKLKRTIQTAEGFINDGLEHKVYKQFNEINWGVMEGLLRNENQKKTFNEVIVKWRSGHTNIAVEGGETPEEVRFRMQEGLAELIAEKADNILVFTHGRAMRIMLCTMLGLSLSKMDDFEHNNTSLYVVEYEENRFKLVLRNSLEHLI